MQRNKRFRDRKKVNEKVTQKAKQIQARDMKNQSQPPCAAAFIVHIIPTPGRRISRPPSSASWQGCRTGWLGGPNPLGRTGAAAAGTSLGAAVSGTPKFHAPGAFASTSRPPLTPRALSSAATLLSTPPDSSLVNSLCDWLVANVTWLALVAFGDDWRNLKQGRVVTKNGKR